MTKQDWLPDQLKTTMNLCSVALLILEQRVDKRQILLPTILEFLYEQVQTILDENCIEEAP